MDKKDVAAITIERSFNKKWWESHRSSKAKGSGVGKALDDWQKHCTKKINDMTASDAAAAEEVCEALDKALHTAIQKCGTGATDTVDGCKKYLKLLAEFQEDLAERSKALAQSTAGVVEAIQHYLTNTLRPNVAKFVTKKSELDNHARQVDGYASEAGKTLSLTKKGERLEEIKALTKTLDKLERSLSELTSSCFDAQQELDPLIQSAQKDARFRPTIVKYNHDQKQFDIAVSHAVEQTLGLRDQLADIERRMANSEDIEGAIQRITTMAEMLAESPTWEVFEGIVDNCKQWSAGLAEAMREGMQLDEAGWARLDEMEKELHQEERMAAGTFPAVERTYKQAQAIKRDWPDVALIDAEWKRAETAYQTKKKAYETFQKFLPVMQNHFDQINAKRK